MVSTPFGIRSAGCRGRAFPRGAGEFAGQDRFGVLVAGDAEGLVFQREGGVAGLPSVLATSWAVADNPGKKKRPHNRAATRRILIPYPPDRKASTS